MKDLSKKAKTTLFILILVLSALPQDKTYEKPSQIIFIRSSLSLGISEIGLGPFIEFGTAINNNVIGLNGILNLWKGSNKRFVLAGGGLNWHYRFMIRSGIFAFSPGVTCGIWREDSQYPILLLDSKWYHNRVFYFGGPKVKMKVGYRHFFFTVEYIGLIGGHYFNLFNCGFEFDI